MESGRVGGPVAPAGQDHVGSGQPIQVLIQGEAEQEIPAVAHQAEDPEHAGLLVATAAVMEAEEAAWGRLGQWAAGQAATAQPPRTARRTGRHSGRPRVRSKGPRLRIYAPPHLRFDLALKLSDAAELQAAILGHQVAEDVQIARVLPHPPVGDQDDRPGVGGFTLLALKFAGQPERAPPVLQVDGPALAIGEMEAKVLAVELRVEVNLGEALLGLLVESDLRQSGDGDVAMEARQQTAQSLAGGWCGASPVGILTPRAVLRATAGFAVVPGEGPAAVGAEEDLALVEAGQGHLLVGLFQEVPEGLEEQVLAGVQQLGRGDDGPLDQRGAEALVAGLQIGAVGLAEDPDFLHEQLLLLQVASGLGDLDTGVSNLAIAEKRVSGPAGAMGQVEPGPGQGRFALLEQGGERRGDGEALAEQESAEAVPGGVQAEGVGQPGGAGGSGHLLQFDEAVGELGEDGPGGVDVGVAQRGRLLSVGDGYG